MIRLANTNQRFSDSAGALVPLIRLRWIAFGTINRSTIGSYPQHGLNTGCGLLGPLDNILGDCSVLAGGMRSNDYPSSICHEKKTSRFYSIS